MKTSYTQRHPYITVILLGLLCTFMTALGSAVSQAFSSNADIQYLFITGALVISVMIGLIIMKKSRFTLSNFGFRANEKGSFRKVWWYIPLIVVEILPLAIVGFSSEVTGLQYIILLFFTIAVGFNEEIYFRGLAFKFMEEKGRKQAVIWTSAVFGVLHLVNVFNSKTTLYVILQMFFAFLVGIVLAEIVSITKSLWALIIWHASHDYISSVTGDALDKTALIILAIQVVILLVFAIAMWQIKKEDSVKEALEPAV